MGRINDIKEKINIPIWEKELLTITEASAYSNIGVEKLRELTSDIRCNYVLCVGRKRLVKRKLFEEFLEKTFII